MAWYNAPPLQQVWWRGGPVTGSAREAVLGQGSPCHGRAGE